MNNVQLLEVVDPELAGYIQQIAQGKLKAVVQDTEVYAKTPFQGLIRINLDVGRNDPCICGSGKKFKKCCGKS